MKDFLNLCRPKHSNEILGNKETIYSLKEELKNNTNSSIFIHGPISSGKTLAVDLISKELNMNTIWIDDTDLEEIDLKCKGINQNKKLYIIDNADSFTAKPLIKKINESKHNLIIICNDPYPLRELEKYCKVFKFNRPTKIQIRNMLLSKGVFKESDNPEKNKRMHEKIEALISESNNDIRHLLNELGLKITTNNKDKNIYNVFDATTIMFDTSESFDRKVSAFYSDTFMMPLMVHENYITNKRSIESISKSADYLCDADTFGERAGPGAFEISNYQCFALISASKERNLSFPQFPKSLGKESSIRSKRQKLTEIEKLDRLEYMPFITEIIIKKLAEKEFEYVKKIFKEYSITKEQFYDFVCELWLGSPEEIKVDTKIKTAFTKFLSTKVAKVAKKSSKKSEKELISSFSHLNLVDS